MSLKTGNRLLGRYYFQDTALKTLLSVEFYLLRICACCKKIVDLTIYEQLRNVKNYLPLTGLLASNLEVTGNICCLLNVLKLVFLTFVTL